MFVLDEHQRFVLGLEALDQALHLVQVVDAHARGRLVQEDGLGPRGQGHAHLQAPLLAMREVAGRRVRMALQPQAREHAGHGLGTGARTLGRVPAIERPGGRHALRGQAQVLAHGQGQEQAGDLKGPCHAAAHAPVVGFARHVVAVEHDAPAADALGAREHVEQGGLARAVGADHRMHGVGADLEVHAGQGGELVVALLYAHGFEQDGGGGGAHAWPPLAPQAFAQAPQAALQSQADDHQHHAQQQQPARPQRGQPVAQQHIEGRAQHRGQQVARAADHGHHQDHLAGVVLGIGQRGDACHHGVQRAGQAGHGARDHEGLEFEQAQVVAHGGGALLVVAHGQQGAAEHRVADAAQQPEHHEEQHGHEAVVLPGRGQRPQRLPGHRQGRARHVQQAVVAAREIGGRVGDEVEHLRKGQGQHHEVGAALAYGHPAHEGRARGAHGGGRQQGQRHGQRPAREQQGDGVAAQAEEDALPEGQQARIAQQQVAAHGGEAEDQHLAGQRARLHAQRHGDHDGQREEEMGMPGHHGVHPLRPSRPWGRSSSTAAMAT
ncbi:hypothetical protein FQR65_LT21019 [Abscondita terminalis]|nr:hypothetical protein FQR65_LT21019 [Abscondita terminalis]